MLCDVAEGLLAAASVHIMPTVLTTDDVFDVDPAEDENTPPW